GGDHVALIMQRDLVPLAQQTLAKFIVFSKATLSQNSDFQVLGVSGSGATELLGDYFDLPAQGDASQTRVTCHSDKGCAVQIEENRFLCLLKEDTALQLWQQYAETSHLEGYEAWNLAEIRSGLGQVLADTQDMFIPQMLNMQLTNGISFTKGCYVG